MFALPASVPAAKAEIGFWVGRCKIGWAVWYLERGLSVEFILNLWSKMPQVVVSRPLLFQHDSGNQWPNLY